MFNIFVSFIAMNAFSLLRSVLKFDGSFTVLRSYIAVRCAFVLLAIVPYCFLWCSPTKYLKLVLRKNVIYFVWNVNANWPVRHESEPTKHNSVFISVLNIIYLNFVFRVKTWITWNLWTLKNFSGFIIYSKKTSNQKRSQTLD